MTGDVLSIEVYSDVVCPWCYIGKRRIDHALAQVKESRHAAVTWRPFELNPGMPKEGMDRTTYLEAKFGSLDAFRQLEERMLAAGREEQITFAFDKLSRTPNTFDAHRLIWLGAREGVQDAVVESLFRGYFEEGADIGSVPALVQLAERAGLKAGPAERFLLSAEGESAVKSEEAEGRKLGIRAVPYFILDRTYGISGAQPVEVFRTAIDSMQHQATSMAAHRRRAGGD
jgi:predicted DsbA family dithiol-disulfide isomerase